HLGTNAFAFSRARVYPSGRERTRRVRAWARVHRTHNRNHRQSTSVSRETRAWRPHFHWPVTSHTHTHPEMIEISGARSAAIRARLLICARYIYSSTRESTQWTVGGGGSSGVQLFDHSLLPLMCYSGTEY